MAKQSLSVPTTNYKERMDTLMHILHYPQKPLCQTDALDEMHYNDLPAGVNVTLMVTTHYGDLQEDAIGMSQAAIDRGLFRSTCLKTYKDFEVKTIGNEELFSRVNEKGAEKLGLDGIVPVGIWVDEGDILVGKITNAVDADNRPVKLRFLSVKAGDAGIVDKVMLTENQDGTRLVKITIRSERIPEIGDKFAALHSQKGVIGNIYKQEDGPFTMEGITPDLIINPHHLPSRMTIGHELEIQTGKYCAVSGKFENATAFEKRRTTEIEEELVKQGYQRHGYETVCDGTTGEMFSALIYTGSCYYQRLKHMVQDKIHARSTKGPITKYLHQPTDGRSREGGLRLGEMERDVLLSLSAPEVLKERTYDLSDPYATFVCDDCGLFCIGNMKKKLFLCKACGGKNISQVKLPYATKQLILQLYSINIAARIKTADIDK